LRLANAFGDHPAAAEYREYGRRILDSLSTTTFISVDDERWEGVLRHATYHYRNGLGVDESVMFGDHYLLEALDLAHPVGAS
jgi:unsaturated chondroitin disaccharide hydrolase